MARLLLALFVLTALLLVPVSAKGSNKKKNKNNAVDKKLRSRREEERLVNCPHLSDDIQTQCANFHIDKDCFI